jgi:hypothetical protein
MYEGKNWVNKQVEEEHVLGRDCVQYILTRLG